MSDRDCLIRGYLNCLDKYGECTLNAHLCSIQCSLNNDCPTKCCSDLNYCTLSEECQSPTVNVMITYVLPILLSVVFIIILVTDFVKYCYKNTSLQVIPRPQITNLPINQVNQNNNNNNNNNINHSNNNNNIHFSQNEDKISKENKHNVIIYDVILEPHNYLEIQKGQQLSFQSSSQSYLQINQLEGITSQITELRNKSNNNKDEEVYSKVDQNYTKPDLNHTARGQNCFITGEQRFVRGEKM